MSNAIEITALRKIYAAQGNAPAKEALKGVDLNIRSGSIFGLLGPNGAGKSTMINILAGLVNKTAGKVVIWGFDQDVNPRQSRAAIGIMPQELNMDPYFSPRASLEVQAGLYGVPRADRWTDELLELVGLTGQADAYARNLSGGMRRRLLLAKALVHRPQILVLDEPTAGVDITLRAMLWNNVRRLNEQGMTIILTTHYLEEAEEMADRIGVINHGEIILVEDKRTLMRNLGKKQLRLELLSPVDAIPEALAGRGLELADDGATLVYSYDTHGERTGITALLGDLNQAGLRFRDLETRQSSLEEIFVNLVKERA